VPEGVVASLNTHDMPPFASFAAARDIEELERLGLFEPSEARRQKQLRRRLRETLERFLELPETTTRRAPSASQLLRRLLDWLASSPAKLVLVNLEDLWLESEPQNIPGRALYCLEEIERMERVAQVLQQVNRNRTEGKRQKPK
jgi:4-alpha-glucanotransferase